MALKVYKKLPVHIVENHNDVLYHIYRAIGGKYLPLKDVTMIHFDSHPDLGIPEKLRAKDVKNSHQLIESLSIENWILPAAFAGHITKIIWCKPPWSSQIECGKFEFYIGEDMTSDGLMKVSLMKPYFLEDCVYQQECLLKNKRKIELHVVELSSNNQLLTNLISNNNEYYILDIDLDFFSTRNPFISMFSKEDLIELTDIYSSDLKLLENDPCGYQEKRFKQLEELASCLSSLYNKTEPQSKSTNHERLKILIENYKCSSTDNLLDENFEIFHVAGCVSGECSLPHHVSTESEIKLMMLQTLQCLKELKNKPLIITVSRSSDDDYCPPEQVDLIEQQLIQVLEQLYSQIDVLCHYR